MLLRTRLTAAALLVFLVSCSPSPPASTSQVKASPTAAPSHTFAGGCAGTVLTEAEPPAWAQGGWNRPKGTPWGVPWAFGTGDTAVAYVFARQLVAGPSPRVDGTTNKVLWETRDYPTGTNVIVEGRPLGKPQPVVTLAGGPSIVDLPSPGCWTFQLSWTAGGRHASTIDLEVLPAGSVP